MNQRNVDALAQVYRDWEAAGGSVPPWEFMTSRGVLVPSALTDEDKIRLASVNWKEIGTDISAELERIAKGEG